jgi:hypothetical protein
MIVPKIRFAIRSLAHNLNPHNLREDKVFFTAILKPHVVDKNPSVTFHICLGYEMAQSGHVHHHPEFQYGGRKTGSCKLSHKMKVKAVVFPLTDEISTKLQQICLHFWGRLLLNRWDYCVTKPECKNPTS